MWRLFHPASTAGGRARILARLIEDVRLGKAPIEQLSGIEGTLAPVAAAAAELCRDLRQRKVAAATLEHEIAQRIANRTDALERVIGTLRQQATRDPLTGLFNRRMLEQHLPPLVDQCRMDGTPLSLLVIDLDNFKALNDTLGHAAGDDFLRSSGQLIRSAAREGDLSFRTGGDEFVILMPGCDRSSAEGLGKRLSVLVDQLARPLRVEKRPGLSYGVSSLSEAPEASTSELLQHADTAVYQQKAARKASR
ncbi:MAG TPA: GGDEF domain-containing protein [Rhizomicrobium sp.]|nr:GGDEF domain-containing protein [Rhizomicrobium sp.]